MLLFHANEATYIIDTATKNGCCQFPDFKVEKKNQTKNCHTPPIFQFKKPIHIKIEKILKTLSLETDCIHYDYGTLLC